MTDIVGVVTHSANVVEYPELVADRIVRFAEPVGRENVVASADCGLDGRVHPQIAWAKLDTLVRAPNWPQARSGARAAAVRSGERDEGTAAD